MKAKSRVLSIAISVLMIFSMLVCGMDQAAFAAQEVNEPVVQNETVEETGDAGKAGLNERSDAAEPEEVVVNDGEPEESEVTEPEEAAANTGGTEESEETIKELKAASNNRSSGTKRTIMLYDVGSDLETEAGLASYNLRQILASRFSSDDDIKFIVMTGGSYRWQLDDDDVNDNENNYLAFPDGVNVPDDAGLQRDPYDYTYTEMLPKNSVISGVYNQVWEARGIDAVDENGDPDPNAGKLVLLDGDGITGESGTAVKSEAEQMSVPETLKAFIDFCAEEYPAEKYDLILWDHGGGPQGGFGADEHYDYGSGQSIMPFSDIIDALSDNAVTTNDSDGDGKNDKFDFIDFDACLMNSVELAFAMVDYTDFYIASAETEPGYGQYYGPEADRDGKHYTGWLDVLGNDPTHDTFDLGKIIVDDFYNFYEKETGDGYSQDGTLAVIDTKKMNDSQFAGTLYNLAIQLTNEAGGTHMDGLHFYDELKSFYNAIEYGGSELFDLGQIAAFLSVVNSEVTEKDLDKDDDYYINHNNYNGLSQEILRLMDNDADNAFMYSRGTSEIRSEERYHLTKGGELGYGSLGTSGMSIFFPGKDFAMSSVDYFNEIDPVIEKMPDSMRKKFLQKYEEAVAYFCLTIYSGYTIDRLINDQNDDLEIAGKSEMTYDVFMSMFKDSQFSMWNQLAVPCLEKMKNMDEESLLEWFKALVPQQIDDAVDWSQVSVEKLEEDENGACRVTVNNARKRIIESVDRSISAELPAFEAYMQTLTDREQETIKRNGDLSLGSVQGKLRSLPEGSSVADMVRWYNESGGVWDVDALEQKWYAISDADNKLHVASFRLVDEDGYYVPALVGTDKDGPAESRLIMLEFSNKGSDGDEHALTSVWFVDMDAGPVKVELQDLTGKLTVMPILWIRPFMGSDIYAPISSSPLTLSAKNSGDISLKYMDVDQIGDIGDVDGDGRVLDSTVTIKDIYGYGVKVSDRIHIKKARIKPGIYTGEELTPEVVYQGRTLQAGVDYILTVNGHYDWDAGHMVTPKLIEPGDYLVCMDGINRFNGEARDIKFSIVLPEEEAEHQVEEAKTALAEAQALVAGLTGESSMDDVVAAMQQLAAAQQQLTDAQEALARTRDILSKEEQARLQDEISILQQEVEDLNEQLAEVSVVDITNYAMTLEQSSYAYTGKAIEPKVIVSGLGKDDYTVKYTNNIEIGTATVTVTARGDKYKGSITRTFTITKRTNPLAAKGKKATVKFKKLKKKNRKLAVSKVIKYSSKGMGTLTYVKASGNKKITINKKTGKVTVKKGLKKGTYKVKVNITASGTSTYEKATISVTFRIRVK